MTETPDPLRSAIDAVFGVLNAIADLDERFQAANEAETVFEGELRSCRQQIALGLKHDHGKTWREVGEIMGGVSKQRAEQISRGV